MNIGNDKLKSWRIFLMKCFEQLSDFFFLNTFKNTEEAGVVHTHSHTHTHTHIVMDIH